MSGIILLTVLALWFFIATKITGFLTSKIYLKIKGKWIYSMVFILVFIAPVMDEIIGGFQFRALCTPENLLIYDVEKLRGKTVEYDYDGGDVYQINKVIPIWMSYGQFVEKNTNNILFKRVKYDAGSGWLVRLIGFSQGLNGSCHLINETDRIFEELNVTKVEN